MKLKVSKAVTDVGLHHKILYILLYVLIGVLTYSINAYFDQLSFINEDNSVQISSSRFSDDFTSHLIKQDRQGLQVYETVVDGEAFNRLSGDEYRVIINKVDDNAIRLWFNDRLVVSEGDMAKGQSMLRGGPIYGSLEAGAILRENTIKIETYATYKTGTDSPVLFLEDGPGKRLVKLITYRRVWLPMLALGFMLMSALYSLMLYIQNSKGNRLLLFFSFNSGLCAIYFLDFLTIGSLNNDYLSFKKLFLLGMALGMMALGFAVNEVVRSRIILVPSIVQAVYYIVIMVIAEDMVQFKALYNIWYILMVVGVLANFVGAVYRIRANSRAFILVIHFLAGLGYSAILLTAYEQGNIGLSAPDAYMIIMGLLPLLVSFDLVLEKNMRLAREKDLRKEAYTQSMTDDLTGIWNKRYLSELFYADAVQSVVAMVDMDNLKVINDNYGHLAGDVVLKEIATMLKDSIRHTDEVCRYGGDEFAVLFKECSTEMAYLILDKVRKRISEKVFVFEGKEIRTSVSIGVFGSSDITIDEMLHKADAGLYKAKMRGRNCIIVSQN